MAGTINKVILIGHLGDNVKVHYFDGGGSVGRFPLATNESYTNKTTGEKVTNTEWHNIVVRNKAAEICEKYLTKGDKIYLEGRIKNRKWQGEKGEDRYTTEIIVNEFLKLKPLQLEDRAEIFYQFLRDIKKEYNTFEIDEGDVQLYLRFHTKEKIKFKQYYMTDRLREYAFMVEHIKETTANKALRPLSYFYGIYKKSNLKNRTLKEIDENLV